MFDKICGIKTSNERSRKNKLSREIVDSLKTRCVLKPELDRFVNQYVAHAERGKSPAEEAEAFRVATQIRIQNQIKNAIWAINQLGKIVGELILTDVPAPPSDPTMHWECGIFTKDLKANLNKVWEQRIHWWRKWQNHYWDEGAFYISPNKRI